jgi:hypothetical protein
MSDIGVLPLPTPAKQTQYAQASAEKWHRGWERGLCHRKCCRMNEAADGIRIGINNPTRREDTRYPCG